MKFHSSPWLKAVCAAAMLSTCAVAAAADANGAAPSPWSGFYGGIHAGHGTSDSNEIDSRLGKFNAEGSGAIGGIQFGYNYRLSPTFIVGIENDIASTRIMAGSDGPWTPHVKIPVLATGRLRGGSLMFNERLFLYGTGGAAVGQLDDAGDKKVQYGWTAGAGMEWAWSPVLTTQIEVLANNLSKNWKKDDSVDTDMKFKTVTFGLNYHF